MSIAMRIRDWTKHFENNRTRNLKKLSWIPVPNKHDGDGYTELLNHPDGVLHFGIWVLLLQVASKCEPRGTLMRDTQMPHNYASIARMTRAPVDFIESAVTRLVEIGWLEFYDVETKQIAAIPHDGASLAPHRSAVLAPQQGVPLLKEGKEGNGKKEYLCSDLAADGGSEPNDADFLDPPEEEPEESPSSPVAMRFPVVGKKRGRGPPDWSLTESKLTEYRETFPGVNVRQECLRALQWCRDNATKRKTFEGMPKFLNAWLARAQNQSRSTSTRSPPDVDIVGLLRKSREPPAGCFFGNDLQFKFSEVGFDGLNEWEQSIVLEKFRNSLGNVR